MRSRVEQLRWPLAITLSAFAVGYWAVGHHARWSQDHWWLAWVVTTLSFAAVLTIGLRNGRGIANPIVLFAVTGLGLFTLRPLFIVSYRITSAGARADERYLTEHLFATTASAQWYCAAFAISALTATVTVLAAKHDTLAATRSAPQLSLERARLLLIAMTALAGLAVSLLVADAGSVTAYINGLANRSSFLTGQVFLTYAYLPLLIAQMLYALARQQRRLSIVDAWSVIAVGCLVLNALSSGGRAHLVLGVLLPMLLLRQTGERPVTLRVQIGVGTVIVVVALVLGLVLRDAQYDGGASIQALRDDPVRTLSERVVGGIELRPFDVLVRLREVQQQGMAPLQAGATYADAPAWFIPRAVWPDKPLGGANTWFTSTYMPRFYGAEKVETSIAAIGEAMANFGFPGVLVVGLIIGSIVAAAGRGLGSRSMGALERVSYAVLTPLIFSWMRGDSFQNFGLTASAVVIIVLAHRWVAHPELESGQRRHNIFSRARELGAFPQDQSGSIQASRSRTT